MTTTAVTAEDLDTFTGSVVDAVAHFKIKILQDMAAPLVGKTTMIELPYQDPVSGVWSNHRLEATIVGASWSDDDIMLDVTYVRPYTGQPLTAFIAGYKWADDNMDAKTLVTCMEALPTCQEILIRGDHGVGKSQLVQWLSDRRKQEIIDVRASTMMEGDVVGYPVLERTKETT